MVTEPNDVLARFQRFLQLDPTNRGLRLEAVRAATEQQQWQQARTICEQGLQQDSNWAELWAHLGFIELCAGRLQEAVAAYDSARSLGLIDPTVQFNHAQACFFAADYKKAKAILNQQSFDGLPLYRDATLVSIRNQHYLEEYEGAISEAERFLAKQSDAEIKGVLTLVLYDSGDNERAEKIADEVLKDDPNQHEARLAHAGVCFETGRMVEAKFDYEIAIKSNSKSGRAWSGKAQIEFNDFQFDQALMSLQQAVKYMPNHIGTWHLMAWIHLLNKNDKEAAFAVDQAMELDRNFGETHGALAAVQVLQGKLDEARVSIKRAQRLAPLGFAAYYAQMLLLEAEGKASEAKALIDTVMTTTHISLGTTPEVLVKKRLAQLSEGMTKH